MRSFANLFSHLLLLFVLVWSLSCCRKHTAQRDHPASTQELLTRVISPRPNTIITAGDSVAINVSVKQSDLVIDSISVSAGILPAITLKGEAGTMFWPSVNHRVGQTTLRMVVYFADSLQESHHTKIIILSDVIPEQYAYRIINKFPHDPQAYTQGLVFSDGMLYESTGLQGKSSLRIVNIQSGKPAKITPLAPQYFGEGIALFRDQIYQVTYQTQVGFVYDKKTLSQIRSFDYQIKEGWGLTTDGKHLIMTDGSAQLYFIEPEFFTQVDKIEVFDNKGMIDSLNEIEYVKGNVLANVYGQTYIVVIDPLSGKVLGKIELRTLMPEGFQGDYAKVLNGIAYNPQTGHLYVTGKNWPVLYELALTPAL